METENRNKERSALLIVLFPDCADQAGGFKAIIEEHGRTIGIASEEGKGTTVWSTLEMKEEMRQ